MITPLEIRQHTFAKSLRGFDADEVRAFLASLSTEWEKMLEDHARIRSELDRAQASLKSFEEVQGILHKTLLQAENASKDVLENAKRDAALRIQAAEQEARAITTRAEQAKAQLEQHTSALVQRRADVLSQLKTFFSAQVDSLRSFESAATLPSTSAQIQARPEPTRQTPPPTQELKPTPPVQVQIIPASAPAPVTAAQAPHLAAPVAPPAISLFERALRNSPTTAPLEDILHKLS
jgi:cell division initiation protein